MIRALSRLRSDRRGISAVEFSMIAPVMILLISGTIEMGYIYMAQTSLTGAVAAAARESSATQESTMAARDAAMRETITKAMNPFNLADGEELAITTRVYHDFTSSRPEDYTDTNQNGRYDGPADGFTGEAFTDRNGNGIWDAHGAPTAVDEVGGEGDVVSYTATYPVRRLFNFVITSPVTLTATSVVRNEPVKTE
jgi:Flp pilus assembly protein TadG